jgi:hypothetical protein
MHLDVVTELKELSMNVLLFRPWSFSRPLILDKKRAPTREPKNPVWVTGLAEDGEL